MSTRVISVALAPPPRPRLFPCMVSKRRSPCSRTINPVYLVHITSFGSMIVLFTLWRSSYLRRERLRGMTYVWRLTESGIALGMWLDLAPPRNHRVVDVSITSARANSNAMAVGAMLPLPCSLAMGAQQARLDANICTSSAVGMPFIHLVHENCSFALEAGVH
jgi:hypothetical protein